MNGVPKPEDDVETKFRVKKSFIKGDFFLLLLLHSVCVGPRERTSGAQVSERERERSLRDCECVGKAETSSMCDREREKVRVSVMV